MDADRSIIVHIGLPKTGTTTLQRALFAKHSEIDFLGKRVLGKRTLGKRGGRGQAPDLRGCRSEAAFRLADGLFWRRDEEIDARAMVQLFAQEIRSAESAGRRSVYSFEGLGTECRSRRQQIIENLKRVFDHHKIVVGIRQPVDLVEAIYFHRLERRHRGHLGMRGPFRRAPTPHDWLSAIESGEELAVHLDYATTIQDYVEAFGRANVGVFPLESLRADREAFARALCGFIEVGEEEGGRLLRAGRENFRVSQTVADRMLSFEADNGFGRFYSSLGRGVRRRILNAFSSDAGNAPARLVIPDEHRASIDDRTREGNRWIASTFGLRLGDLGYAL